jgi:deoxyribodipyrimidine photolyase-related protein
MLGFLFPHQCFRHIPEHWREVHFVRHDIGYGGKYTTVDDFHVARKIFLRAAELAWIDHMKAARKDLVVKVIPRGKAWGTKGPCEVLDVVDVMLEAEIHKRCPKAITLPTPAFLLSKEEALTLLGDKEHVSHAAFYGAMRKRTGILMTKTGKPEGGQLRFDTENRQKIGKGVTLPNWEKELDARQSKYVEEAAKQIQKERGGLGEWTGALVFPTTHQGAHAALQQFLKTRLNEFGPYEDAITAAEKPANDFHFHSVLSAPINAGLLTATEVLEETMKYADAHKVPLASLEGFIAQILGWREYMRAVYLRFPTPPNRLQHRRTLSAAWYEGTTGLLPVDTAIRRVNRNAYLHHIERLMIVGNAMFLAEIKPTEVYRWFMEMFADSWDWVMVGNVYYMSQWASDAITTKPYISSSAYVLRMSDYPKGDWCKDWDALYWSTVARLAPLLRRNYRMAAQVAFWERKDAAEKKEIQTRMLEVLGRL